MALEGSIGEFGLADILQLIYFQRKSGVLQVESPIDTIKIYFSEGNIISVKSHRRPEEKRIGQILVKKGLIDKPTLQRVLNRQKETGQRFGVILLQEGLVSRDEITELIKKNIIEQVAQLFKLTAGSYVFRPQNITIDRELPISLDTQHILMDGLRIVDEWSTIEDVLTIDTIFRKTERAEVLQEELTEEEKEILQYIDGENDVSVIVDLSGMDDYLVSKTLVSLHEKGLIEPLEEEKRVIHEESPRKRLLSPVVIKYLIPLVMVVAFLFSLITIRGALMKQLKRSQALAEIERIRFSIEINYLETGTFPDRLAVPVEKDPWGNNYIYRISGDGKGYQLMSAGPDGVIETSDDVF